MRNKISSEIFAAIIVNVILKELKRKEGFVHWWENIEINNKLEIIEELEFLVKKEWNNLLKENTK